MLLRSGRWMTLTVLGVGRTWAVNHDISRLSHHFISYLSPVDSLGKVLICLHIEAIVCLFSLLTAATKKDPLLKQVHYFRFPQSKCERGNCLKSVSLLAPYSLFCISAKVRDVIRDWKYLTSDLVSLTHHVNCFSLVRKVFLHSTQTTGAFVPYYLHWDWLREAYLCRCHCGQQDNCQDQQFFFLNKWTNEQVSILRHTETMRTCI